MICSHPAVVVDNINEQGALVRCLFCNTDLEFVEEDLSTYLPFQHNSPQGKDHDIIVFILQKKIGEPNV